VELEEEQALRALSAHRGLVEGPASVGPEGFLGRLLSLLRPSQGLPAWTASPAPKGTLGGLLRPMRFWSL
jgi:hypothetical protein